MSTNTIQWTERDVESAAQVLAMATADGAPLPTLTDEEVVALDGVQREQAVPTPWLSAQTADRDALCGVALRGLLAKELAYPVIFEGESEPSRLHTTPEITGTLALRRTSRQVASLERTVSTGKRWLFAYTHDDGVLLEEVDESGLHGFTVTTADTLPARLAAFIDPQGAATQDSGGESYSETEFESAGAHLLSQTLAAGNLAVFETNSEALRALTIYTGAGSVHVLTPHSSNGSLTLELKEVSARSLEAVLAATLSPN
jgi:hypothetical protein